MQRHASRLAGECGIRLPVDLHSTTARLSGSTELAEVSVTPSAHFGPCKLSKSNHAIDMSSIYMYRLSMMICQVFACGLLHSKIGEAGTAWWSGGPLINTNGRDFQHQITEGNEKRLLNHECARIHTNSELATKMHPPSLGSFRLRRGFCGTGWRGKQEAQNRRGWGPGVMEWWSGGALGSGTDGEETFSHQDAQKAKKGTGIIEPARASQTLTG
jgi:hypothetical protein